MSERVCNVRLNCPGDAARGAFFFKVFRLLHGWIDGSARLPVGPPDRGTLRNRWRYIARHGDDDAVQAMDKDG